MAQFPLPMLDSDMSYFSQSKLSSSFSPQINGSKYGKHRQLCGVWRDIQGAHNWNGLLHPMSPTVEAEALRYGQFEKICYDAFDGDSSSKYYGTISTDQQEIRRLGRRDIVIAWRGTQTPQEYMQNLRDLLVRSTLSYKCEKASKEQDRQSAIATENKGVRVEKGFLSFCTSHIRNHEDSAGKVANMSARDLVIELRRLLKVYESEIHNFSITFTEHSLGAALATYSAYGIKKILNANNYHDIPVTVFSFASPRVGNLAFAKQVDDIGLKVLRFINQGDLVPNVPGIFFNENLGYLSKLLYWLPWTYFHVGVNVCLENNSSL